ncbi:MAG TPA: hypothetical protein VH857_13640 [Actinomycetes bacterium]|nr:hypothetical protein [Actinomycetes bacterium]
MDHPEQERRGGRPRTLAPAWVLAGALAGSIALAGCGSATPTSDPATSRMTHGLPSAPASPDRTAATGRTTSGPFGPDGPGASDAPDPALSGQATPTLPPGDPGTTTPPPTGHDPRHRVTDVPATALVDTASLGAVAGGTWVETSTPSSWCSAPRTGPAASSRSQLLTATPAGTSGRVVESVTAHDSAAAAADAVAATTARLQGCGLVVDRDPRLGQASEQLTGELPDGAGGTDDVVALVLASERVGVVLVASGRAAQQGAWESLADLALGSSCAASPDGCH